jgi:hypothetical protein
MIVSYPEDNPILDGIAAWLRVRAMKSRKWADFSREGECVEFTDASTGKHYEIVVREIDERSNPKG